MVLLNAIEEDGAILPGGAKGNQIRKVVEIMDGTISKVLQSGGATVELELWRVHTEHIKKVSDSVTMVESIEVARHTIPCSLIRRLHSLLAPL